MSKRWIAMTAAVAVSLVLIAVAVSRSKASPQATSQPTPITVDGGSRTALSAPEALAFDGAGRLLVSEYLGNDVVRIDRSGSLTAVAGTGVQGFAGDGGPAIRADLNMPTGLAFRPDGTLVLADHRNHCIRSIDDDGIITTIAGTCTKRGVKGDGGPATKARLDDPIGVSLDAAGNLYIADEQNGLVRRVTPGGTITTVAGGGRLLVVGAPDGTLATDLKLSHPSYVVAGPRGSFYFTDFLANEILRVDASGRATRVAGTGQAGFSGDGGPATKAELDFPTGLAMDGRGILYVSDANNHRVRMIDRVGVIRTVAGSGTGSYGGDGGPARRADLNAPAGLAFDDDGNLFIADQGNDCVRMVDRTGTITLVAGNP